MPHTPAILAALGKASGPSPPAPAQYAPFVKQILSTRDEHLRLPVDFAVSYTEGWVPVSTNGVMESLGGRLTH